jgi:histone deacetylase complex regulatory component SIN3
MATKLGEDTQIQVSLKTIISMLMAVIVVTSVVIRYETKIDSLSDDIDKLKLHIKNSAIVMQENTAVVRSLQIEQTKQQKDIEYIKQGDTQCPKK